jgi:hypothetical protein
VGNTRRDKVISGGEGLTACVIGAKEAAWEKGGLIGEQGELQRREIPLYFIFFRSRLSWCGSLLHLAVVYFSTAGREGRGWVGCRSVVVSG